MNPLNRWLYGLLVVITTSLMGSSFTVGKIGIQFISPVMLAGLRFTIAGLTMAAAVAVLGRPHPRAAADWVRMAIIGLFQTAGVMGCIFLSLRTITAGESSILTFTNPVLVVVFSTVLGTRYRLTQWVGVVLGIVGVAVTLGLQMQLSAGTLLGLGSGISWAIATLLIKRTRAQFDVWVLTAYQMLFGGALLLIGSTIIEQPRLHLTGESVTIVLWLAMAASIVQFGLWFFLLQRGDPGKTSAFLFLAPVFGVFTGWIVLDEPLHLSVLLGGALVLVGIFLVNWQPQVRLQRFRLAREQANVSR